MKWERAAGRASAEETKEWESLGTLLCSCGAGQKMTLGGGGEATACEAGAAVVQGSHERLCGFLIRVFTAAEPLRRSRGLLRDCVGS